MKLETYLLNSEIGRITVVYLVRGVTRGEISPVDGYGEDSGTEDPRLVQ